MIVDSSAVVAILVAEPERDAFVTALVEGDGTHQMSAGTRMELGIVVDRLGDPVLSRRLDDLIRVLRIEVQPVTATQAEVGRTAYRDYGKGSGHPAQLNFGDCFAYALARETGHPLLFKGDDFIHTDVTPAA